jgi:hypothetical protein
MKKQLLGSLAVVAIAAVAAFNINLNFGADSKLSTVTMSNVEALASGETGTGKTCYKTITSKEGSQILYCPTCAYISGTDSWTSGTGTC